MTASQKNEPEKTGFKPFTIEVTLEHLEEALYLWLLLNGPQKIIKEKLRKVTNDDDEEKKFLQLISGVHIDDMSLFRVIDHELKEQGVRNYE